MRPRDLLVRLGGAALLTIAVVIAPAPTAAQKQGGTLRIYHFDSPPSMSVHEEVTVSTNVPMMGVFNNLVLYDQHVARPSLQSIVPELATSWSWSDDGKTLTFTLRGGVKWHDGQPFTARDVKCTGELLFGRSDAKFRTNPRRAWYQNVEEVSADSDNTASLHLKRPQPALLALLASGLSPVYPYHVSPAQMRQQPIGTGPFKFVEFKPNEMIKVARNPDYWKPGLPHLDAIEYPIIKDVSTRLLAFIAGKTDLYPGVTMPQLKDVKEQMPQAVCDLYLSNTPRNLIV